MNEVAASVITIICAYLLGSIPSAYIAGRLKQGIDIRMVGSRNMGAMNSIYTLGMKYGLAVLIADAGKGALAVLVARLIDTPYIVELAAGGVAVIGHMFPVFLRFKGGKGGATVVGVFSITMPWIIPWGLGLFGVLLLITRYPTFSYAMGLCTGPFIAWRYYESGMLVVFSIVLLLLVLVKYSSRLVEMRAKSGGWKRVFFRQHLKDRF